MVYKMTFLNLNADIAYTEAVILETYGDRVSVQGKLKALNKFGRNNDIGTAYEDVNIVGGTEVLPSGNDITHLSSSNASDTQNLKIEGHTISGSDLTFVVQDKNIAGQTKTALDTPLHRVTRIYNNGSTDFAGTVYVYEDDTITAGVPDTPAKLHIQTNGDNNQSLKCATSLSKDDYWIITSMSCGVNRQNTRSVDFVLQVKEQGKVFRTLAVLSVSSNNGTITKDFYPFLIVRPNSDVRVRAISSGASTGVEAVVQGFLAIKL